MLTLEELAAVVDAELPHVVPAAKMITLSQAELARQLELTDRQVRNLHSAGLPHEYADGGRAPRYRLPLARWWYEAWTHLNKVAPRRGSRRLEVAEALEYRDLLLLRGEIPGRSSQEYIAIDRYVAELLVNARIAVPNADLVNWDKGNALGEPEPAP